RVPGEGAAAQRGAAPGDGQRQVSRLSWRGEEIAMAIGQQTGPRRRRWTRKEFYRLLDLNFFREQRVELIEGEIVLMPAQNDYHAISISLTEDALRAAFGPDHWVRVQMSLDLSPLSVVDPDLAVIEGTPRDHVTPDNPTTALLIVEVSETTLRYDRRRKASLY